MMMAGPDTPINAWRSWPRFKPGRHFPFPGCETWNTPSSDSRVATGEAEGADDADDERDRREILEQVRTIVHSLGGRLRDE